MRAIVCAIVSLLSMNVIAAEVAPSQRIASLVQQDEYVIKSQMKDPQSTQFGRVWVNETVVDGKQVDTVCGDVNSKNSYGGYSGMHRFLNTDVEDVTADMETQTEFVQKMTAECFGGNIVYKDDGVEK